MVRKIKNGEWLKRVDNMTAAERAAYAGRVGEWLSAGGQYLARKAEVFEARLQNVLQVSVGWNDQECQTFEEGAVLLSALAGVADTKLPELLYAISAKRAIRRMTELLQGTEDSERTEGTEIITEKGSVRMQAGAAKEAVLRGTEGTEKTEDTERGGGQTAGHRQGGAGHGQGGSGHGQGAGVPVRPRHIDQYVHLLPVKTQERAATYGPLMRELDEAREKVRLLMEDRTASAGDREAWAKRVAAIDKEIGGIRRELDAGWEKLVKEGRVVVDDLGNARISEEGRVKSEEFLCEQSEQVRAAAATQERAADATREQAGDDTAATVDTGGETAGHTKELTSEQKHRRRELRKWLTDTRRGNGSAREKRVEQWRENFREYLVLEGDKAFEDEKVKEAMAHYGIDIASLKLRIEN